MTAAERQTRLACLAVLGAGALLRGLAIWQALLHHPAAWFYAQASELAVLGDSLARGHGLASPFGVASGPSAFLAPGYPAVVAMMFRLFGSYSAHAEVALMLLQMLFALCAGALMMFVALRVFGAKAAVITGVLWALSPTLLFFPIIFWESSLSCLLLAALLALAVADASYSSAMLCLLMVIVFYVNPSLLPAALGILLWSLARTHAKPRAALVAAAILSVMVMSLWPVRNERVLHAFIPTRSNLGYELWQGNRPGANGFFDPALHPNNNFSQQQHLADVGEVQFMHEKSALAIAAIRVQPLRFLGLTVKRFGCFWTGIEPRGSFVIAAFTMLSTLFGMAGLLRLLRQSRTLALLFALPLVLFPLPYYITHPDFRFRAVLDCVMFPLAAFALSKASVLLHWKRQSE